jgi:hypothetical protein
MVDNAQFLELYLHNGSTAKQGIAAGFPAKSMTVLSLTTATEQPHRNQDCEMVCITGFGLVKLQ